MIQAKAFKSKGIKVFICDADILRLKSNRCNGIWPFAMCLLPTPRHTNNAWPQIAAMWQATMQKGAEMNKFHLEILNCKNVGAAHTH